MEILFIRHGKSVQSGGGHLYIPLSRALKTAEIIGQRLHVSPIVSPDLIERSDGIFDGLTQVQAARTFPVEYQNLVNNPLEPAPNGESFRDVRIREESFLREIVSKDSTEIVACVSHGGLLNTLVMTLLALPASLYPLFHFENVSISSVIVNTSGKAIINYINRMPKYSDHP